MSTKINSKTSLKTIKELMQGDFGILLTNEQAKEIRDSRKRNTSLWSSTMYSNLASNAAITKVTERGVHCGGGFYSTSEWNKAVRAGEFE